jgi:hypothetical protein
MPYYPTTAAWRVRRESGKELALSSNVVCHRNSCRFAGKRPKYRRAAGVRLIRYGRLSMDEYRRGALAGTIDGLLRFLPLTPLSEGWERQFIANISDQLSSQNVRQFGPSDAREYRIRSECDLRQYGKLRVQLLFRIPSIQFSFCLGSAPGIVLDLQCLHLGLSPDLLISGLGECFSFPAR